MKVSEAIVEYLNAEIIPNIAGDSEMTAAILSGALKASKNKITEKINSWELLKTLGAIDQGGNAAPEVFENFLTGMFEKKEKVSTSLAEIVKVLTGVDSSSSLLQGKLSFSLDDAQKFLDLLKK